MTDRHLEAYLDGVHCGTFVQTSSGNLTFAYDDGYRRPTDATPLSLSMPLAAASHAKRAVLPYLQGLLPDSDEALAAIGRTTRSCSTVRRSLSPRSTICSPMPRTGTVGRESRVP